MDERPKLISRFERQDAIWLYFEKRQKVSIQEVAERFSVSNTTARRDIDQLAKSGKWE